MCNYRVPVRRLVRPDTPTKLFRHQKVTKIRISRLHTIILLKSASLKSSQYLRCFMVRCSALCWKKGYFVSEAWWWKGEGFSNISVVIAVPTHKQQRALKRAVPLSIYTTRIGVNVLFVCLFMCVFVFKELFQIKLNIQFVQTSAWYFICTKGVLF